ncbi:MAG: RsmE family RNA methyltransferase, partial [Acutalibacteraceae bacterium]|nr:RsmE family RNA methyltransferase [Acutalibacteraceae bacterium]
KLELVTQKATELGVSQICPVLTARSVSRPDAKAAAKKQERLQRIALEAAKQSGRGAVPAVAALTDFRTAVQNAKGAKILFYEGGGAPLSACLPAGESEVSVFIGPEGGFDAEEVEFARAHGAVTATLGPRILRTETAPLAALAILMFMTGNME